MVLMCPKGILLLKVPAANTTVRHTMLLETFSSELLTPTQIDIPHSLAGNLIWSKQLHELHTLHCAALLEENSQAFIH